MHQTISSDSLIPDEPRIGKPSKRSNDFTAFIEARVFDYSGRKNM
jgi:hypothetical protein